MGWAYLDCYNILEAEVRVQSPSLDVVRHTRRLLRSFVCDQEEESGSTVSFSCYIKRPCDAANGSSLYSLYRDGICVGRTRYLWRLFQYLERHLHLFIADNVRDYLLLHAGAVSKNGAGVILPAPSGSGKSSLTLALVQQGYRYHSDELAVVEPSTGELHAFPKPFSVKNTSLFPELARQPSLWFGPEGPHPEGVWYIHPGDVVPNCIGAPVPIRYIVFPQYDPAAEPSLRPLPASVALRELILNSVNLYGFGREGLPLLASLVERAESFSLTTSGLEVSVRLLEGLLGDQGGDSR